MLPNDRLGKNRLPVCPRGQIADVLEPLAATTAADRGGADGDAGEGRIGEREQIQLLFSSLFFRFFCSQALEPTIR